jgi:putative ABC transport system ATP-binding protein
VTLCRLEGVGRVFAGAVPVRALDGVSLDVEAGQFVAIHGPSGSGKSTLLNILGLLDRPTSGTYWLNGIALEEHGDRQLAMLRAETIGFVFQEFHLLPHLPVLDNVALGAVYQPLTRKERYELAYDTLGKLGLTERVTAATTTLSGGERQRVAVARAILGGKRLLLCDEPTGNLDLANSEALLDILSERVAEGAAAIVVTHDPEVAARANRRYGITDGRIEEH